MFNNISEKMIHPINIPVSGADPKMWVEFMGSKYLMKYTTDALNLKSYSEHVGSRFFNILGVKAQNTLLIDWKGLPACLCEDFTNYSSIHSYFDIESSSIDTHITDKHYTFNDVEYVLSKSRFPLSLFKKMFLIDAIIANRDRHGGNWGYLSDGTPCRVFDNGASLFPNILKSYPTLSLGQLKHLVYFTTKSSVQLEYNKSKTFYDLLSIRTEFEEEIEWLRTKDILSSIQEATMGLPIGLREFYTALVFLRYECIIERRDFDVAYKHYTSRVCEAKKSSYDLLQGYPYL